MSKIVMTEQSSAPDTPGSGKVAIYVDTSGSLCFRRDDGTIAKIASAGTYSLTIPATGTAALLASAQTFTAAQTFSGVLTAPGIKPASDSATAVQIQNTAGTAIVTVDTTGKIAYGKTFQVTVNQNNTEVTTGVTVPNGSFIFLYDSNSGNALGAILAMYRTNIAIVHQGALAIIAITSTPTTSQFGVYLNSGVLCFNNNYTGLGTCVIRGFILGIGT